MKEILKQLLTLENEKIYLLTHRRADPDAVASCIILKRFFREIGRKNIYVIHPEGISRRTLTLIHNVGFRWRYFTDEDIDLKSALVVLDTGSIELLGKYSRLLNNVDKVIWIDHHKSKMSNDHIVYYVNSDASSTTEILLDSLSPYLHKNLFNDPEKIFITLSIYLETARLSLATDSAIYWVNTFLRDLNIKIKDITRYIPHEIDISYYPAVVKALSRAKWLELKPLKQYIAITYASGYHNIISSNILKIGLDMVIVFSFKKDAKIHVRCRDNNIVKVHETFIDTLLNEFKMKRFKVSHGGHKTIYNIELLLKKKLSKDEMEKIILKALEESALKNGLDLGEVAN